jgi:hypothetical protein
LSSAANYPVDGCFAEIFDGKMLNSEISSFWLIFQIELIHPFFAGLLFRHFFLQKFLRFNFFYTSFESALNGLLNEYKHVRCSFNLMLNFCLKEIRIF